MDKKSIVYKIPVIKSLFNRTDNLIAYLNNQQDQIEELRLRKAKEINVLEQAIIQLKKKDMVNASHKLAVYTAIIGDYDAINEPRLIETEYCDYYCFTNNKDLKSETWNIVYLDQSEYEEIRNIDQIRLARFVKTHPHLLLKDYEQSLWLDGNLTINKSVRDWVHLFSVESDILVFTHPDRNNIYDEAKECIRMQKDNETVIRQQVDFYKKEQYRADNGLAMTNVLYRKHTKQVESFDELWWKEIKNRSRRDQLSFNYVLWKLNMKADLCGYHASNNDFFLYKNHLI